MTSAHSGILGLADLARREGMEMRPVLLRVLTDLFVAEPVHLPAETARFAELASRLLDRSDSATRATVAERLADYDGTPVAVALKLAHDDIVVADPVLRRSPVLGEPELASVLDERGVAHAVAIAARGNLPASIAERLRLAGTGPKPAPALPHGPRKEAPSLAVTTTLARRFLVAGSDEQGLILTAMGICPPAPHEDRLRSRAQALGSRLERAALRRRVSEFYAALQQVLGMPRDVADRVRSEPSGAALAVLCRALDMPFARMSRILLFLSSGTGGSVSRIFKLEESYRAMPALGARRLVAAWCGLGAGLRAEGMALSRVEAQRPVRERSDVRDMKPTKLSIRCVTPARPASSNGS